jgi:hypothetical protein
MSSDREQPTVGIVLGPVLMATAVGVADTLTSEVGTPTTPGSQEGPAEE